MRTFPKSLAWTVICLLAAFMLAPLMGPGQSASACWNAVVTECFDRPFNTWPWTNPIGSGRGWSVFSNSSVRYWGIQEVVYSADLQGLCGTDEQSCWIQGGEGVFDPDFDPYVPNLFTWMSYGPFDLSLAESAVIQFELYCESELLGDSITWGIADDPNIQNADILLIDSSFSGSTHDQLGQAWANIYSDLNDMHDLDGNDGSALGMNEVYAFWLFDANSNAVMEPPQGPLDNGAFIDNVQIQWDDGGQDMLIGGVDILHPDTTLIGVSEFVEVHDSIVVQFTWSTCAGGGEFYEPVRIQVTVEDPLSFETTVWDTVVENVVQDTIFTWVSPPYEFLREGVHTAWVEIDPENEIAEVRENNNINSNTIEVWPPNPHPEFTWITPGATTDTIFTDSIVVLRWEVYDQAELPTLTVYNDIDNVGCGGQALPGGINITAQGPDSLVWSVYNLFPGTVRWPFVLLHDSQWDTCIYAPFPVMRVDEIDAADPVGVAAEFHLAQNYPNPFNPQTEISYGISQSGQVTLKVHDVLGREVGVLVNEHMTPGNYSATFEAGDLPSGVYLYTLSSPQGTLHRKMILMK